jgi:phosphohistidine phosphatase SixA
MSRLKLFTGAAAMLLAGTAQAQFPNRDAMVAALRRGGYVILMRHASSPREVPDKKTANPDNAKPERQLDEEGRSTATAMGRALRSLKIPIGDVFTSPTYRALETIKYAQLGAPKPVPELGENGQSMAGGTEAQAAWLRTAVTQFPRRTNTILVTHFPNIRGAFPQLTDVSDGEGLIYGPDGKGGATLMGRIKIEEWAALK